MEKEKRGKGKSEEREKREGRETKEEGSSRGNEGREGRQRGRVWGKREWEWRQAGGGRSPGMRGLDGTHFGAGCFLLGTSRITSPRDPSPLGKEGAWDHPWTVPALWRMELKANPSGIATSSTWGRHLIEKLLKQCKQEAEELMPALWLIPQPSYFLPPLSLANPSFRDGQKWVPLSVMACHGQTGATKVERSCHGDRELFLN